MAERVVGIDLGTSTSVVAVVEGDRSVVIPDQDGVKIQPSVVSFTPDGEVLVGTRAKKRLAVDPVNTIYSVKRFIGRNFYSREVKVATVYYKPARNRTGGKPDFFVEETDDWLVFPHEICGLTDDEIRTKGAAGAAVLD